VDVGSHLEELDVCVEEVALGDVDALDAELVHQAQDAGRDDRLHIRGHIQQGEAVKN